MVTYKNRKYTTRRVDIKGLSYNVGPETLESKIQQNEYDKIAIAIDCQISYYVPDHILNESDDDIAKYIVTNVDTMIEDCTANISN
jgi:hypothetical protein